MKKLENDRKHLGTLGNTWGRLITNWHLTIKATCKGCELRK